MVRKADIWMTDKLAGRLEETESGYEFTYNSAYLNDPDAQPVSVTLPLRNEPYKSPVMFSFFDGLIPEGWLLDIAVDTWKIDRRDRMGLLMACCKDCIGAVSVIPVEVNNEKK